jgi:riboflavin transporter FmnP
MGIKVNDVLPMLLPTIVPFNLIKGGVNAIVAFLVYKSVGRFLKSNA